MSEVGLYEAMSTLRAVRRLRPDPVPDDVLQRVLQAAAWAPTGGNTQPWRVVLVKDSARKARLGELYLQGWQSYSKQHHSLLDGIPDALRDKQLRMLAAGDHLSDHFGEVPAIAVFCFNPGAMAITDRELDRISVVGGGSVYTAVENLLLACRAEGLGCTLTTLLCGYEPSVKQILEIPDDWGTACAIPMGYPVLGGHGPISRRPVEKLTYLDQWGEPFPG